MFQVECCAGPGPSSNSERVNQYIKDHKIDLSLRLKTGTRELIAKELDISVAQVRDSLKYLRVKKGITTADLRVPRASKYSHVHKFIIDNGIDISKRLPKGSIQSIANKLKIPKDHVKNAISIFRNNKKVLATSRRIKTEEKETNYAVNKVGRLMVKLCGDLNLVRDNPNSERSACDRIITCLKTIPAGGAGMIIGTPTAFCASNHLKNNMLLTDNLKVAIALELTTDTPPCLVIGTGVDPLKAALKQYHWNNNNATSSYKTVLDIVDRDSFTHYVSLFANKYSFVKVILMTSGSWVGSPQTNQKWGLDLNFKAPSEYLIKKYHNLHVIAMTTTDIEGGVSGHYQYKIHYLHRGETKIID